MKVRKILGIFVFMVCCAVMLQPAKAEAAVTFTDFPIQVVDDMADFDKAINKTWEQTWNLDKSKNVTEQCSYGKFTLEKESFVRIKMETVDEATYAAKDYFRLYADEAMTTPLTDNGIDNGFGDDYLLLKAGTYYIACGSKLYMKSTSQHHTLIKIGVVPKDKAVEVKQTASADRKSMQITFNQKFAALIDAKWCEGKVTKLPSNATELKDTTSFAVSKNGWYTVWIKARSSVRFNKDVEHFVYVNVTGIGAGAKKGVTYKSGNLKYKLVKAGFDGLGTVMVIGLVKQTSSVTIPKTVKIGGQTYKVVKINGKAFYKKSKIKKVTIKSPYITSIGKNAFKGINKKATFKVPKSKLTPYKKLLTSKTGFAKKTMKVKK